MISKDRADKARSRMIEASFTAWQVRGAQGEKISWERYLMGLGLAKAKEGSCDNKTAIEVALDIDKRVRARQK